MSQLTIMQILKEAEGKPLSAEDLMRVLKEKGEEINEQSFYSNIDKIENDRSIGFKEVKIVRTASGRTYTFNKRVWFYRHGARN